MNDLIRHRGPDDEGFLLFQSPSSRPVVCGGPDTPRDAYTHEMAYAPAHTIDDRKEMPVVIAFGHRRLSILDLSPAGHQPMCTQNGRYWIVYNGEVYNHIELKEELESLGHRFRSSCDTEVMLAAYEQWGPDCLGHFDGMWAFAIYDTHRKELFLARDRFGIKPLYYWVAPDGTFCFASEIKQFTAFPGWKASINPQRTYDFLAWGMTDHTDETLFAGVYQLRPGHSITLSDPRYSVDTAGRVPATRWYELQAQHFKGTFEDAATAFNQRFSNAIRLHLRADVPVGSCLSGGLDSSSIVCVVNNLLREQNANHLQQTFSACSHVKRFDERQWIEEVVRQTGVEAHYVYPSLGELFTESPDIAWHQDEPFGSTRIYAQWNVFRLAAQNNVKVMLDGQGADEQLAGYHGYFGPRFVSLLRSGQWLRLWKDVAHTKRLHGYSRMHSAMQMANILLPDGIRQILRARAGKAHANPNWLNLEALGAAPTDPLAHLSGSSDSVYDMSRAQLTADKLQRLLHWEDRNSMAHSVESRVPFLDHRLVEFVLGLPDDFKIAAGVTKRVQRAGMSGILPDGIRDRVDKLGFETPEETWLRETAPDLFREKLQGAIDAAAGLLHKDECRKILEDTISGRRGFSFLPWRLISFGEWSKKFSVAI
jgi:asparagine synthase (glutamine-hydrolysing)